MGKIFFSKRYWCKRTLNLHRYISYVVVENPLKKSTLHIIISFPPISKWIIENICIHRKMSVYMYISSFIARKNPFRPCRGLKSKLRKKSLYFSNDIQSILNDSFSLIWNFYLFSLLYFISKHNINKLCV